MLANLRINWRRYLASGIAIMLCTLFTIVMLGIGNAMNYGTSEEMTRPYIDTKVVVKTAGEDENHDIHPSKQQSAALLTAVNSLDQVSGVTLTAREFVQVRVNGSPTWVFISQQLPAQAYDNRVVAGKLPRFTSFTAADLNRPEGQPATAKPTPVAISQSLAKALNIKVGQDFPASSNSDAKDNAAAMQLRVAAIIQDGMQRTQYILGSPALLQEVAPTENIYRIAISGKGSEAQLLDAVNSKLKEAGLTSVYVANTSSATQAEMTKSSATTRIVQQVTLLAFPLLALFVGISVVTATFQIMLTSRTRELALLRCIGATPRQLRRMVLAEAFFLGIISSVLGTVFGYLLLCIALNQLGLVSNIALAFSIISWQPAVTGIVIGVLMALIAAWRPARAATRVPPVQALAGQQFLEHNTVGARKRSRVVTALLTLSALVSGTAMGFGLWLTNSGKASGGSLFFLTVLCALVFFALLVVLLARGLSVLVSLALRPLRRNATLQLTAENIRRDPRRTSATGTAVVVGVAIVTTLLTGAATVSGSLNDYLKQQYPLDVAITTTVQQLEEHPLADLKQHDLIVAQLDVPTVRVAVNAADTSEINVSPWVDFNRVSNIALPEQQPGTIASTTLAEENPNSELTLSYAGKELTLRPVKGIEIPAATIPAPEFNRLVAGAQQGDTAINVFLKLRADATGSQMTDLLKELRDTYGEYAVSGGITMRGMYLNVMEQLLRIALVLVAMTVVIALLGVTNTLALSVAQRQRESALLRAIGMTKAQLRRSLVAEAAALGMVAILVGVVLGIAFGWIGAASLPVGGGVSWQLIVPWGRVGAMALVTLAATLLATWIPVRMATRINPVEALARAE